MHEFSLIKNFFLKLSRSNVSSLNLNDDVFFDKKKGLVISTDTYNQDIHFLDFKKPDLVIKKIIRSSISDLICKGVKPKFYFISGAGNNKNFSMRNLSKISNALKNEQKKYQISLSGGDTTFSKNLSFSITTIGYSKNIIYRNKAKFNDDIYVTGNLGDSYVGLQIQKKKINVKSKIKKYFINSYYCPDIKIKLTKFILKCANTSIDISDGLVADLEKLINQQNLSYKIIAENIPISKHLKKLIHDQKLNKTNLISRGDDYQILFTASPDKARIINNASQNHKIKITKIGKITSGSQKSIIISKKGKQIAIKKKGFVHQF